ncbi:MAG TPA: hypothetical protein VMW24_16295 [Sedimentisphaerales bacterium]|nr:hypothetical protein [Sedimentisphaerales bacterium]
MTKTLTVFSTQDHATPTYVRDAACWAYGLDLTCISPWNSGGSQLRAGVLISPRHVLFAAHYMLDDGCTIRFITQDNQVVTRTMTSKLYDPAWATYGYPDLAVGILDSDVPEGISFAKILPSDWEEYLPLTPEDDSGTVNAVVYLYPELSRINGIPLMILDQEEKALVHEGRICGPKTESVAGTEITRNLMQWWMPRTVSRLEFWEDIAAGDSGNPVFAVVLDELVLLAVVTTTLWGTALHLLQNTVNAWMTSLGGGYQLTPVDLGQFTKVA